MIKEPLSCYIECLKNEGIHHSAFITADRIELQLWQKDKLNQTLELLESRGVAFNSVIRETEYYLIRF